MNKTYRLIFDPRTGGQIAVGEHAKSNGKKTSLVSGLFALVAGALTLPAGAVDLPVGGQIVSGTASVNQAIKALTVNQSSQKLIMDWQGFSIGAGSKVTFVQPSSSSVALNRVTGSDPSVIQGNLTANGQVFLLNPNGVLFTPTSQVNVGGLVASTLSLSNSDFLNGKFTFQGDSLNGVVNQGTLNASPGGTIALIAAKIENSGTIAADRGNALLGAGSMVTLDIGAPVKLTVDAGALDALITNGGAIRADGGTVMLTAKAANELMTTVINNTGQIRAQTLVTGEKGEIQLLGGMTRNEITVGGKLDASAPNGGDGGFIETSAARVSTLIDLSVMAGSQVGKSGTWLVDPYNYTIDATAAGNIVTALNGGTSVTVSTQSNTASYGSSGSNTGSGDITVSSPITMTGTPASTPTLALQADRNIMVNSSITSTGGPMNITLSAANNNASGVGGIAIAASTTINSKGGNVLIGGAGGNVASAQTNTNGIGYALNFDSNNEAVLIGVGAQIKSGGGNITINGYSTSPVSGNNDTTGVHIGGSALIDSGYYAPSATSATSGGYINITGKYVGGVSGNSNKVFGVKIDNPSGGGGQTTIAASTTTGGIRIIGSSTYDAAGSYALNMATNGLSGNIYFAAYSVADLIFILNNTLSGVTFNTTPPTSGCRSGYPYCGQLVINSSANNSYLYATYNAVNPVLLPIYVSATLTGTKVYDGGQTASNLNFSNVSVLDPNGSGYASSNVTSASYTTPSANVGSYTNLSQSAINRNYTANGKTYVLGYNFVVSPAYTITQATASLSAVKTYDGNTGFTSSQITASGVGGETLSLAGLGSATSNSSQVIDNGSNYLTSMGGLTLANGTSGTIGLARNYQFPSLTSYNANNTATINQAGISVLGMGGSKYYDGTQTFTQPQITLSGILNNDDVALTNASSATVSSPNAGTYNRWLTSNLSLTGANASNYTLSGGTVSAVINKAPLGVALNATYNGTTSFTSSTDVADAAPGSLTTGGTLTVKGLVGSEKVTGVIVSDANVDAVNATSNYVSTVSGSGGFIASNYAVSSSRTNSTSGGSITNANNTAGIVPAPLGIAVTPTYNGSTTFTSTAGVANGVAGVISTGGAINVAGLQNGQTLGGFTLLYPNVVTANNRVTAVSGIVSGSASVDPRNYVLNVGIFGSANAVTAGTPSDGSGATNLASLSAAPLTVTANNSNKTYGQTKTFAGTEFTSSGLQNNESIASVTLTSSGAAASAGVAGSPYTITPSAATGSGFLASNYTITYTNGSLVVGQAPLTLTPNNVNKPYGQTLSGTTTNFTTSGLQNNETVGSATQSSAGLAGTVAAGNTAYGVTLSNATGGTFDPANYSITYTPYVAAVPGVSNGSGGAITVIPAALTVTANDANKTYGQTKTFAGTEFTSSGLQNNESIASVTLTSSGAAASAGVAGSPYTITPSAATGSGFLASNYTITYTNGSLVVGQAPLTLTPNNVNKPYGQTLSGTTTNFTTSGLQNNETVGSATQSSTGLTSPAAPGGVFGITLSSATGGTFDPANYNITYTPYVPGVSGGAVTVSPLTVQYVPVPVVVQPVAPLVLSPSGLNYIPISSSSGSSAGAAVPTAATGSPATSAASSVVGGNAATGNTSTSGDNSSTNGEPSSTSTNRSTSQLTAIGQVRDLLGPTNVRVFDGGINVER